MFVRFVSPFTDSSRNAFFISSRFKSPCTCRKKNWNFGFCNQTWSWTKWGSNGSATSVVQVRCRRAADGATATELYMICMPPSNWQAGLVPKGLSGSPGCFQRPLYSTQPNDGASGHYCCAHGLGNFTGEMSTEESDTFTSTITDGWRKKCMCSYN